MKNTALNYSILKKTLFYKQSNNILAYFCFSSNKFKDIINFSDSFILEMKNLKTLIIFPVKNRYYLFYQINTRDIKYCISILEETFRNWKNTNVLTPIEFINGQDMEKPFFFFVRNFERGNVIFHLDEKKKEIILTKKNQEYKSYIIKLGLNFNSQKGEEFQKIMNFIKIRNLEIVFICSEKNVNFREFTVILFSDNEFKLKKFENFLKSNIIGRKYKREIIKKDDIVRLIRKEQLNSPYKIIKNDFNTLFDSIFSNSSYLSQSGTNVICSHRNQNYSTINQILKRCKLEFCEMEPNIIQLSGLSIIILIIETLSWKNLLDFIKKFYENNQTIFVYCLSSHDKFMILEKTKLPLLKKISIFSPKENKLMTSALKSVIDELSIPLIQ